MSNQDAKQRACRDCALKAGWKPDSGAGTAMKGACRYCGKVDYHLADHDYGFIFDNPTK